MRHSVFGIVIFICLIAAGCELDEPSDSQPVGNQTSITTSESTDYLRDMQFSSMHGNVGSWGHWGERPARYSSWTSHSNRLIPVYTWGLSLDSIQGENSIYRDKERLQKLYDSEPEYTLNPYAEYFDQTEIYGLQKRMLNNKKYVFLIVFDGMDWPTTQAAAAYNSKSVFSEGRGSGLHFLDLQDGSDFGYMVTSPMDGDTTVDTNAQVVLNRGANGRSGYAFQLGGSAPWSKPASLQYLINKTPAAKHWYTDSASSATSMASGIKTFNGSINTDDVGNYVTPVAREYQQNGYAVGAVSSVPISHATPACSYANNVNRNDYQDITRDLLGLRSVAHRVTPLPGLDVLIGAGWGIPGENQVVDQGNNFVPGNKYVAMTEMDDIDVNAQGKYVVAQRTTGRLGSTVLFEGAKSAIENNHRLFGFFGAVGGHLPYRTADGNYDPTKGNADHDEYSDADIIENPTLRDMTKAAIDVLARKSGKGFWLMVESGDVDWANHNSNLDDSIGAVLSGDAAFKYVHDWVEKNSNWNESAIILTADHGHLLVLNDLAYVTGDKQIEPIVETDDDSKESKVGN